MKRFKVYWNIIVENNMVADFDTLAEAKHFCKENTKGHRKCGGNYERCCDNFCYEVYDGEKDILDSIVPLWNRKKHKTSVDGQTFKSLWIQTLLKSQISTIVDSSRKARGCPGFGRGFFVISDTCYKVRSKTAVS